MLKKAAKRDVKVATKEIKALSPKRKAPLVSRERVPVAVGSTMRTTGPRYKPSINGIRICHREFVQRAFGSDNFGVAQFVINAGNPVCFPWLSTIASKFETYKVHSLTMHFITSCPTSFPGKVGFATDYDSSDNPPTSMQTMYQWASTVTGPVWDTRLRQQQLHTNMTKQKTFFVTTPNQDTTGQDPKTLNMALQYFTTEGIIDANGQPYTRSIGDIWMEYDIELNTPKSDPGDSGFDFSAHIASFGADTKDPFGTFESNPRTSVSSGYTSIKSDNGGYEGNQRLLVSVRETKDIFYSLELQSEDNVLILLNAMYINGVALIYSGVNATADLNGNNTNLVTVTGSFKAFEKGDPDAPPNVALVGNTIEIQIDIGENSDRVRLTNLYLAHLSVPFIPIGVPLPLVSIPAQDVEIFDDHGTERVLLSVPQMLEIARQCPTSAFQKLSQIMGKLPVVYPISVSTKDCEIGNPAEFIEQLKILVADLAAKTSLPSNAIDVLDAKYQYNKIKTRLITCRRHAKKEPEDKTFLDQALETAKSVESIAQIIALL